MIWDQTHFPISLTLDIDWAPDFIVAECAALFKKYGVPATFFATHRSSVLNDLMGEALFEVGIHPNFLPGTTQGRTPEEIMDTVLDIVPTASGMRTHGLCQSTPLFYMVMEKYPTVKHEFSLFLPGNNYIKPFEFFGENNRSLMRTPYQWEDDLYCLFPLASRTNILFEQATYQMLDFHPIHLYLNSRDASRFSALKNFLKKPLFEATPQDVRDFRNEQTGTQSWLLDILETVPRERFVHASQIPGLVLETK